MKGREFDHDARRKPASETLAQIFIQGNGVTDKGVSMIAKACLFSPTIKRIDLSDNKLTDRCAINGRIKSFSESDVSWSRCCGGHAIHNLMYSVICMEHLHL